MLRYHLFLMAIGTGLFAQGEPMRLETSNSSNSATPRVVISSGVDVSDVKISNARLVLKSNGAESFPLVFNAVSGPNEVSMALKLSTTGGNRIALFGQGGSEVFSISENGSFTPSGGMTVPAQSEIRFLELTGSNYVGLKAPDSIDNNVVWKLPSADGMNGQFLSTDGAGNLSWKSVAVGGGGTVTSVAAGTGLTSLPNPITNSGTISLANTSVSAGTYGSGTQVAQFTVDQQGRITLASNVAISGASPTGAAGGDLTGSYPNPTVAALQGKSVAPTMPASGQVLKWNGTQWAPAADSDSNSGGTVTSISTGAGLTGGPITGSGTISVATGGITNSMLQSSSVTVTAGTGLTGGGSVALGSSVTLTNSDRGSAQNIFKNVGNGAGVTQFTAGSNNDTLRFEGTGSASVTFDSANKKIVINTADTNSGGTVTQINTGAGLAGGPITSSGTISVAASGITNSMLQNSAVTVSAGAGLSGGGSVALGNSVSVSIGNAAVTNAMLVNSNVTVTAGSGLSGGGSVALGGVVTLTNADKGSSQNIFKNVSNSLGETQFSAGSNGDSLQFSGSGSTSVSFDAANKRVIIISADTNSGGTVTSVNTGSGLTGGPITSSGTISIATGGVTNAMLQNSSVTLAAGAGLTGGGSVALGSSVTLTNTDKGSSQNIFKNIADSTGTIQFSAASNSDKLLFEATGAATVSFDAASNKITFSSTDTNSGGTVTSVNTGVGLTGGPITASGTISIANGGVTNSMLQNASVTITAGTGLGGGGTVTLGSSVTLTNSGVLSVIGTGIISSSGGQNPQISLTGVVPVTNGGTGNTTFATNEFLTFDGTKIASSGFTSSSFAAASHTHGNDSSIGGPYVLLQSTTPGTSQNGNIAITGTITAGNINVSGGEYLKFLRGTVNANATIAQGVGFTVAKKIVDGAAQKGIYVITFTNAFSAPPSATANPFFDPIATGGNGNIHPSQRLSAVIASASNASIEIAIFDHTGKLQDSGFCFIATGNP